MAAESARTGYDLSLSGNGPDSIDTISSVYDATPMMAGVTIGVVLLFTGVTFRSVVVPVRSVLTIILTLAFTYGVTSLIYGVRWPRAPRWVGFPINRVVWTTDAPLSSPLLSSLTHSLSLSLPSSS